MPLTMRPPCDLANVEANGHGEIESFTGQVRRWQRKRLCAPYRVDCLLIESRKTRRPHNAARHDLPSSVERECEFSGACLVPRPCRSRITFVTFHLQGNPTMPGR